MPTSALMNDEYCIVVISSIIVFVLEWHQNVKLIVYPPPPPDSCFGGCQESRSGSTANLFGLACHHTLGKGQQVHRQMSTSVGSRTMFINIAIHYVHINKLNSSSFAHTMYIKNY